MTPSRPPSPSVADAPGSPDPARASGPFVALLLVFAALGLFGVVASTLVPAMRTIFAVGLTLAVMVQWLPLVGGGLCAVPMARLLEALGAVRLMQAGLAASALVCLALAELVRHAGPGTGGFAVILLGILALAVGATALQVAINPLALALGPARTAPARLTLAQGCNSLGVLAGVHLSARLSLASAGASPAAGSLAAAGVSRAYFACALVVVVVLVWVALAFRKTGRGPAADPAEAGAGTQAPVHGGLRAALRCGWALSGAFAIALYVGAEGVVGALLVSFLHQPEVLDLPLGEAGIYLANVFWGGAAISRLGGAWLLRGVPAPVVLGVAAGAAALASLLACGGAGWGWGAASGWAALGLGLCNGVMFPLIFALTLERSSAPRAATSGLLVLAISGGAIASALAGYIGEHAGLAAAFAVPLAAYAVIALFALVAARGRRAGGAPA
ncbi:MAG: glucose/galactose MFS transporter [Sphingomonadales bacterium]|nr:glucose/galactose MFS transporter [Sphingomonadales bacterium]